MSAAVNMMESATIAIPMTIVLAAAQAIVEAAVVITVTAAWKMVRVV